MGWADSQKKDGRMDFQAHKHKWELKEAAATTAGPQVITITRTATFLGVFFHSRFETVSVQLCTETVKKQLC